MYRKSISSWRSKSNSNCQRWKTFNWTMFEIVFLLKLRIARLLLAISAFITIGMLFTMETKVSRSLCTWKVKRSQCVFLTFRQLWSIQRWSTFLPSMVKLNRSQESAGRTSSPASTTAFGYCIWKSSTQSHHLSPLRDIWRQSPILGSRRRVSGAERRLISGRNAPPQKTKHHLHQPHRKQYLQSSRIALYSTPITSRQSLQ